MACGDPQASRVPWLWLVLAAAGVALGIGGSRLLTDRTHFSDDPRLDRAARAVVERGDPAGSRVVAQGERLTVLLPLGAYLGRERAVRLAIESGRLRRQALDALGGGPEPQRRAVEVVGLSLFARGRLAAFLKVSRGHAQLLLYATGWPWVGTKAEDWQPAEPPLAAMAPAELDSYLELAWEAVAWPAAQERLRFERGLTDEQVFAVRARLLRGVLADAFGSRRGPGRAKEALAKYADLAPAQAETVLAMAGALELARAGPAALPALDVMAATHPELADAIREAVRGGGF